MSNRVSDVLNLVLKNYEPLLCGKGLARETIYMRTLVLELLAG